MTAALAERRPAAAMSQVRKPELEQVHKLVLAALPSAVSCARLLVHSVLSGYRADRGYLQRAERVMDELVAHAVATTGVIAAEPLYREAFNALGLLRIRVRVRPDSLIIEVWDSASIPPAPQLSRSPVVGRAQQWGYDLPAPGQRVVWCVLPPWLSGDQTSHVGLPKREPQAVPRSADPATATRDPAMLSRVLNRLRRLDSEAEEDPC